MTFQRKSDTRLGLSLVEMIIAIAIIISLIGLLLPAVQQVKSAANNSACKNHLRQFGVALTNYDASYQKLPEGAGRWPPDGQKTANTTLTVSFHLNILPQLEQDAVYLETLSAWEDISKQGYGKSYSIEQTVIPVMICPLEALKRNMWGSGLSSYVGVFGSSSQNPNGLLGFETFRTLYNILDGASNTILVGERPTLGVTAATAVWFGGTGTLHRVPENLLPGMWYEFENPGVEGCAWRDYPFQQGNEKSPCSVHHFWSRHANGANFLFADGSVRSHNYKSAKLLPALASYNGNETFASD